MFTFFKCESTGGYGSSWYFQQFVRSDSSRISLLYTPSPIYLSNSHNSYVYNVSQTEWVYASNWYYAPNCNTCPIGQYQYFAPNAVGDLPTSFCAGGTAGLSCPLGTFKLNTTVSEWPYISGTCAASCPSGTISSAARGACVTGGCLSSEVHVGNVCALIFSTTAIYRTTAAASFTFTPNAALRREQGVLPFCSTVNILAESKSSYTSQCGTCVSSWIFAVSVNGPHNVTEVCTLCGTSSFLVFVSTNQNGTVTSLAFNRTDSSCSDCMITVTSGCALPTAMSLAGTWLSDTGMTLCILQFHGEWWKYVSWETHAACLLVCLFVQVFVQRCLASTILHFLF